MKKIIAIIWLLVFFLLGACSDFLEEESQDEVKVKTVKDFSEFLLGSGYPVPVSSGLYQVLYLLDDDMQLREAVLDEEDDSQLMTRFGVFSWQPDMWERVLKISECYSGTYDRLMGVNATLDYVDDAIYGTQEEIDQVKAEALALRAYYYYMLVNIFGEPYNYNKDALGVPLKLLSDMQENGFSRNTVKEIYDQIVKDLKMSSDLFEKYPARRGNYRINTSAVNILLSRVYLYMEEWENAITAANKAIRYAKGLTDYTKISGTTEFQMVTYDHSEVEWLYGDGDGSYSNARAGCFEISEDLYSKYTSKDRRLSFWFSDSRVFLQSWQTVKKETNTDPRKPTNTIRVSEAYLNRAEAYAQILKLTEALSDLNKLRRNRIVDYEDVNILDQALLIDEIRLERRRELCFDEHRWFDLRRYGMPSISHKYRSKLGDPVMIYTLKEKDPLYTLPIPNTIIEKNTKLKQNASAYEPIRNGI